MNDDLPGIRPVDQLAWPKQYEWHYAPMNGGLMRKELPAGDLAGFSTWTDLHAAMDEFIAERGANRIVLLRTEAYGNALFSGHSGRVDVYGPNVVLSGCEAVHSKT